MFNGNLDIYLCIRMYQYPLDSSTLDQETKRKESAHRKAKVVSMKRIKTKVYVRD